MAGDALTEFLHRLRRTAGDDTDPSDADLVGRYAAGRDDAAFAELVRRHGPMVLGVCRRVLRAEADAEDAFQATFLVLARRAGAVGRPAAVGNWLYGVAYNVARRTRTMNQRRTENERAAAQAAVVGPWEPADSTVDDELNRLPDKYRAAVVACGLEGRTIREAAADLGWPPGTVAARLARGRALLAARLARRGVAVPAATLAVMPPTLATATVRAAGLYAAGRTTGAAAALADAALAAMARGKALALAAVVIGVGLTGGGAGVLVLRAAADPPAAAEKKAPPPIPKPAETADQRAKRVALQAHARAAAFDKLPRFDYQVCRRHAVVDSLRAVQHETFDPLVRGLTDPVRDADWTKWYERGFSWDETRFLWESRPGETTGPRSAWFWTATDAWERSESSDASSVHFCRTGDPEKYWVGIPLLEFCYLRLTPHRYWWGQTKGDFQNTVSPLPPDRVTWRSLGVEPFGGEECDVVDSVERGQRLWVGQVSGHVRGALEYRLRPSDQADSAAKHDAFVASERVRVIAGRAFETRREYSDWQQKAATDAQKIDLQLAWHELNPQGRGAVFAARDLVRFDDYQEVAPRVWLPFRETRTSFHWSEAVKDNKPPVYRSELRVTSVRTDRDLADTFARLMPREGDRVQDQRFAVAVDITYKADRPDDEIRRQADADYQERLKNQELLKRLMEPIEAMVGKPAPALPADGWVGGPRPDAAGKPYLVQFWAEWCGPCKNDLPRLKALAEQGVIVVGMHLPGTPAETVTPAVRDNGMTWPTFVAPGKAGGGGPADIAGYRAGAFPYYVLVDARGRVAGHGHLAALMEKFGVRAMTPPKPVGVHP